MHASTLLYIDCPITQANTVTVWVGEGASRRPIVGLSLRTERGLQMINVESISGVDAMIRALEAARAELAEAKE